jgi:hypothetical protein
MGLEAGEKVGWGVVGVEFPFEFDVEAAVSEARLEEMTTW